MANETQETQENQEVENQEQTTASGTQAEQEALTFDSWFNGQDEQIKTLINDHISGLKSTVASERNERKKLASQLRELSGKLEGNEAAQAQLATINTQLESMNLQTSFYEVAHEAGVADLRAAYLIAQDRSLIDKKGNIDMDGLKAAAPYLFRKPITAGNAGNGTGKEPPRATGMNDFIRAAAGRS